MPTVFSLLFPANPAALNPIPPASGLGAVPVFPITGARADCDAEAFDQAHFLALLDRRFPLDYLTPMKTLPNSGYEQMQGASLIAARVSTAITNLECGAFFIFAEGGVRATGIVEFLRPTDQAGAFTIQTGTIVSTTVGRRQFQTLEDAVFGTNDVGPIAVAVQALADGYEYNVPGLVITAGGEEIPGDIDIIELPLMDPPDADRSITVRNVLPTSGGRCAWLDGLADNRGLTRADGESDPSLRVRSRSLPDAVTPDAFRRTLENSLSECPGLTFDIIETFEHRYQECWDAPSPNAGTPTFQAVPPANPNYSDTVFVYDDPRLEQTTLFNEWLGLSTYRAAVIIVLNRAVTVNDFGLAYDDPATSVVDINQECDTRGVPAYDVPPNTPNTPPSAYDGQDLGRDGLYAGAIQNIIAIAPAGVNIFVAGVPEFNVIIQP